MSKFKAFLIKFFKWDFSDIKDDIAYCNEVKANRILGLTMVNCALVLLISLIFNLTGIFDLGKSFTSIAIQGIIEFVVPAIICYIFKGRKKWLKWVLMLEFVIALARLDCILVYNVPIIIVVPLILSCRYYNDKFTISIAGTSLILLFVASWASTYLGLIDRNHYLVNDFAYLDEEGSFSSIILRESGDFDRKTYFSSLIIHSIIPKILIYIIVAVICIASINNGKAMMAEELAISAKSARVSSELELASKIQAKMLPSTFPAFPDRKEFDLFATMTPAKEVGGDFYDFFFVDENKICLVIADVSGKGVPAALFMVVTRTLIKNYCLAGLSPAQVLTSTNNSLLENNEAQQFVTAWLGLVDLNEQTLTYSVAGHNPPLIKHRNGSFEYLSGKSGLVLAGMEGYPYKEVKIDLKPGDRIFLYTDGVTEANSKDGLFGTKRLQEVLNANPNLSTEDSLLKVKEEIDKFAGGLEQFDDITMLMFSMKNEKISKDFEASVASLDAVREFIEYGLALAECPLKLVNKINIAVEEIFVNIASYAYKDGQKGLARIEINPQTNEATIVFIDNGNPFNPFAQTDPDISESADDREIGGLGIYMVKQLMDDYKYEYKDNQNILTIVKRW